MDIRRVKKHEGHAGDFIVGKRGEIKYLDISKHDMLFIPDYFQTSRRVKFIMC